MTSSPPAIAHHNPTISTVDQDVWPVAGEVDTIENPDIWSVTNKPDISLI